MIFTFCLLLLIVAGVFRYFGAMQKAAWFAVSGLGLLLITGLGLVAMALVPMTQISNRLPDVAWGDHNSIVLLGAGTNPASKTSDLNVPVFAYGRIAATAMAYNDCRAHGKDCNIVVSGGDPLHHGYSEAFVYGQELLALGVPQTAIVLEGKSRNTWQNAAFSTQLIPATRQIVVVTSGIHLKRALLMFDHFRPGAQGIASDRVDAIFGVAQSGYNFFLTDAVLHEQIGTAQFYLYNALGLNKGKTR